ALAGRRAVVRTPRGSVLHERAHDDRDRERGAYATSRDGGHRGSIGQTRPGLNPYSEPRRIPSSSATAWSASRKRTVRIPSAAAVSQFTSVSSTNTHSSGLKPSPSRSRV